MTTVTAEDFAKALKEHFGINNNNNYAEALKKFCDEWTRPLELSEIPEFIDMFHNCVLEKYVRKFPVTPPLRGGRAGT